MGRGESARKRDGQSIAYVLPNVNNGVSVAVGVNSIFGIITIIAPGDNDYEHLIPVKMSLTTANVDTVTPEVITIVVTATYEDATTQNIQKTTSSNEVIELDAADFADLTKDAKRITKIEVKSHTNQGVVAGDVTLTQVSVDYP